MKANIGKTGDEEVLEGKFTQYDRLIDNLSFGLEHFPQKEDETFETYFERLIKRIHGKDKA